MIITFSNTTIDTRTNEKTFWFQVKLPGYECTCIDVGFNKDGKHISGSGSFFSLDSTIQEEIVKAAAPMVKKVV